MHDDLLERRLRDVLRSEADGLSFTITAAELERRLALRRRTVASRRLTLLLAATVAVGAIGLGSVTGGPRPFATEPPGILAADGTRTITEPLNLGSLDEFMAVSPGNQVVVAQAHDPVDVGGDVDLAAMPSRVSIDLGSISGPPGYQVTVACQGSGPVRIQTFEDGTGAPHAGFPVECNAGTYTQPIFDDGPFHLTLDATRDARWRIVVRRLEADEADAIGQPPDLGAGAGEEKLVEMLSQRVAGNAPVWRDSGLRLQSLGPVAARWDYSTGVWCEHGTGVRLIFGHELDGTFAPTTETLVPCDNRVHQGRLGIPAPYGSEVFLAAPPEATWSVLVAGEAPPIAIAEDRPGWQRNVAFGPHLSFDSMEQGFTGPGVEGGGPVLVVFACAGTTPIDVAVDVGRRAGEKIETFVATCTPEGAETGQAFDVQSASLDLRYAAPTGNWTAITILVPDPLPDGG